MNNQEKLFIVKQAGALRGLLSAVGRNKGLLGGAALGSAATGASIPGENWVKDVLFDHLNPSEEEDGAAYGSGFSTTSDFINRGIPGFIPYEENMRRQGRTPKNFWGRPMEDEK